MIDTGPGTVGVHGGRLTSIWQPCASCHFRSKCTKGDNGCYHPVFEKLPTHQLAVERAHALYRRSGAEDATEWLTAQYLELMIDERERWRHAHPDGPRGDLTGGDAGLLHYAEVAARGVVHCFSRCPEPEAQTCETCRFHGCRRKDGLHGEQ